MFEFKDYYELKAYPHQPESFLYFLLIQELKKKRPNKLEVISFFQKHKASYKKIKYLLASSESSFGDKIGLNSSQKSILNEIESSYKKYLKNDLDRIATYHANAPASVLKEIVRRKFFELETLGKETPKEVTILIHEKIIQDITNLKGKFVSNLVTGDSFYQTIYKVYTNHFSSDIITIMNERRRFKAKLESVAKKRLPASKTMF
ncbi:MAG: hypothetical protein NDI63_10235 [Pseudobdellovibrio sp.]|nr:hypothetical protein [Pseudobdellovibrio sp.]